MLTKFLNEVLIINFNKETKNLKTIQIISFFFFINKV